MNAVKARLSLVCIGLIVICMFFTRLSYAKIDTEALVGLWFFDEGKGDVVKDSSDKGNDGKIVGDPEWVDTDEHGKALKCDGDGDYVEVEDNESLHVGKNDFTVVAWVNPAELKQSGFVTKGAYCWEGGWIFDMPDAAGTLRLETCAPAGGAGSLISKPGVMVTDKWQFIAVTVTRGKASFLYRDSEEVARTETIDTTSDISCPEYTLYFGSIRGCGQESGWYFNGLIAEVALFNGLALTKDDIDKIMAEGLRSILAVASAGKLTTTWATIKAQD